MLVEFEHDASPPHRPRCLISVWCEPGIQVDELSAQAVRSVIIELPDDRVVGSGRALLEGCAFREVARVPDYYRDGVALVVLQRAVSPVE